MRHRSIPTRWLVVLALTSSGPVFPADFQFRHHFISHELPIRDNRTGDYGLTALVDVDRDGDLDFVLGGRPFPPSQLYWFEFQAPARWVRHVIGTNFLSDVGLAPLDVDRDGWLDFICSGVWYRNTGKPREQEFERLPFDAQGAGSHDIVIADVDGDGKPDAVSMGDERTKLNALCWYSIPKDPRKPWTRHPIGPPVHGAITPAGVADLDGDGDVDVVRADTWFENAEGTGTKWIAHTNIPMGRKGPFGVCVRSAIVDMDGDGKAEVVMVDADITDSKVAVLRNADGKGGRWEKVNLPQSFTCGSLHALAVADLNGDGKPDVIANEQEELLPAGRENPRWIVWENLGGLKFREHVILDATLGGHELQVGDVDGDGDIDICSKPWGPRAWNGNGGKMHVDFLENLRLPARAAEDEDVKKDLALLQGEWSMVSGAADGQSMPEETRKLMKRVCQGDEATTTMGGQVFMKAKITVDPSKKPKTIDYQMTDGFTKGKRQLGIYEIEGDTFKACFGKPGAERPTDFTSEPGDGRTLSVWKREKPVAPSPQPK